MDIHDLKIFLTIAQEGSVSKASKILYMTPQGTSKVLKNLEIEMGCQLFIRDKSGMKLTESGEKFREYALKDVDDYYQVKKDILHIEQRQKKVVDLLSAYGILRLLTPDCLVAFREKYPDIEFHYREYPDLPVEQLFAGNEGNVAFSIGDFDEHLYQVVPLETFPIRLLVNEKHPLAQKESVTIEDLQGEPMFIESSQFHIYHLIVEKCEKAGFEPDIIFQTSGFSLCHKMVKENKGISVAVDFIYDDMREDGMKLIPFSDGIYEWKACMLTRRDEEENEGVQCFRKHVQEWLQKIRSGEITR
ncbi:LysR family transcriptional regulator [Coprococcus comes]|uniref:LysR family transcriptional regulator n=1 Tax=Coprococcus comes TaxID=410072 RepID=UPI00156D9751|nr:LysR family transcriptional regulator [Coprococcus comes]NSF18693.1 LysR family transcriptional regulator [Coprococcus comes]